MANDALVLPPSTRPAISTLVQTYLDEQLYEAKLWSRNVALQLIAGVNGYRSSYYGIGTPRVEGIQAKPDEMFISGLQGERARSLQTVNSDVFQPLVKTRAIDLNVTRHTSFYDNNAVQNDWQDNTLPQTFVRPVARWCYNALEVVISKDEQYWLQAGGAVPKINLVAETAKDRQSTLMSQIDLDWHTSNGPSSTTSNYWSAPYSFQIACDTSSIYLGVDRSDATNNYWKGNTVTAQTSANFHDLINYANYNTTGPQLAKFGYALRYLLVNGDLYTKALVEAESRGMKPITMDKIPAMAAYGFKETGAIEINGGQQYIVMDPNMPAGHVFGFNPNLWSVGFRKKFEMTPLVDQSQFRGQARVQSAQLEALYLGPICHAPWTQVYWTNVS